MYCHECLLHWIGGEEAASRETSARRAASDEAELPSNADGVIKRPVDRMEMGVRGQIRREHEAAVPIADVGRGLV